MKTYEMIREIENSCSNNQMRDVFFEEVECESPEEYVRSLFPDKKILVTSDRISETQTTVYVDVSGLTQKYIFTEI